ncbi:MAG TPA: MFS transporter [Fibrobacteria bacterium]|mgnify:CR=1 FL=1|nr:MFS transporter [Fibrobacteria bacterium]HOX50827.1 MFS transporter [Fibrobacteria bacterium]
MQDGQPNGNAPWIGLVVVAALGYFVDIYDLILFNVIKTPSLQEFGFVPGSDAFKAIEVAMFNWQMFGMLLGGLAFGILGDRKGRVSALFGSILLYSLANLANSFVHDMTAYQACRFFAGLGLAGELGAGVTLVSETMPKRIRGWGTVIIVTFGTLGAVAAFVVGKEMGWRNAYLAGGALGLVLLFVRMRSFESAMFLRTAKVSAGRGNFLMVFRSPARAVRFLSCIAIGIPIWFAVGVLVALSSRFAAASGAVDVNVGQAVMFAYIGISAGDLVSGVLSQVLASRRKVILAYLLFLAATTTVYLNLPAVSSTTFYVMTFLIGCGVGYWALFVTVASEQFGTEIRSTVANTVPNFVRGAVIPITFAFQLLGPGLGVRMAAGAIGAVCLVLALIGLALLPETFGKELDYLEADSSPA